MIIEVSIQNESFYKGGVKQAIKDGYFSIWTDERIRSAFNLGHGTKEDFNRYKENNKGYCKILEVGEEDLPKEYL